LICPGDSRVATVEGTVKNISRDGALIAVQKKPEAGTLSLGDTVVVAIPLNENANFELRWMHFEGVVVRQDNSSSDSGDGIAVRFDSGGVRNIQGRPIVKAAKAKPVKVGLLARTRGSAMVEIALMVPFIFFLFVGVLDFGFFNYAAICAQNAARAAALAASYSTGAATFANACAAALPEMNQLPNTRSLTCATVLTTQNSTTDLQPLAVFVRTFHGPDWVSGVDNAVEVVVEYRTILMIPIPGILDKQFTFSRTVTARIINV
jgi:Flp pilus assembly protein TadG